MNYLTQQLQQKDAELKALRETLRQQEDFLANTRFQEEFLRSIYDNVQEAIFVVDIDDGEFRYRGFNATAIALSGIKDVVDKTPAEILPPEAAKAVVAKYRECIKANTCISYEECLPFRDKNTWWITNLQPIRNEAGEIYRIIGTSLNITEREASIGDRRQAKVELDREQSFLEAILNSLDDGIVACDRHGILTLFNSAAEKFHGLPLKSIPADEWAKSYDLYLSDSKTPMLKDDIPLYRVLRGESVQNVEMMIIPEVGKSRFLLANGNPVIDRHGEKIGAVVAMRDLTERKKSERELAKLNDELEARVKLRTNELQKANLALSEFTSQLRRSNQELQEFANIISHDLKAPLRAIANLTEWIEEDLAGKLEEETQYNMNLLKSRVARLKNLIDGLLSYSRVGRLKSEPQLVEVPLMLAEILDSLNIPNNCQIEIAPEMPTLVTDKIPLQQVFSNLINNALKHSDRDNTKITISVKELDAFYEFVVTDNGKGIDPQYHERIFDIFSTLQSRDKKDNTGIGLSIVKKAVESQGGEIKVESQLDRGSTFRFTWKK